MKPSPDMSVYSRAQSGDAKAWAVLWKYWKPKVRRHMSKRAVWNQCRAVVRDTHGYRNECATCESEALTYWYLAIMRLDPAKFTASLPDPYICAYIKGGLRNAHRFDERNKILEDIDYRKRKATAHVPTAEQLLSDAQVKSEVVTLVRDAVSCVPNDIDRQAVKQWMNHDLDKAAVGRAMGITRERARQRITRALSIIKPTLEEIYANA